MEWHGDINREREREEEEMQQDFWNILKPAIPKDYKSHLINNLCRWSFKQAVALKTFLPLY